MFIIVYLNMKQHILVTCHNDMYSESLSLACKSGNIEY